MPEMSIEAFKETQRVYLTREITVHERDIQRAEGKVTENKELLTRINDSCNYCGDVYGSWKDDVPSRLEQHIMDRHPADWNQLQELKRQERAGEAIVD